VIAPFAEPVHVTRPLLPPLPAVIRRLEDVWAAQWLTNGGAQHVELESALRAYLDVPELSLFNNGTIALLAALRALELTGEVITTPFTFPATPHTLAWLGLTPVFADIDPLRLTLAPEAVERAKGRRRFSACTSTAFRATSPRCSRSPIAMACA
jgi:dTDP-4-amino-4,6-dideoxygalactose transaminase